MLLRFAIVLVVALVSGKLPAWGEEWREDAMAYCRNVPENPAECLRQQKGGALWLENFSTRLLNAIEQEGDQGGELGGDPALVILLSVQAEIWNNACRRLNEVPIGKNYQAQARCVYHLYRAWCESFGVIDILPGEEGPRPE